MKRGFTLIELLLVVIIIGILVALALPRLGVMAERFRTAEATRIIGAFRTSLSAFYLEHGNWPNNNVNLGNNQAINGAGMGSLIYRDRTLFNYQINFIDDEATIIATRNTNQFPGGDVVGAVVTAVIDPEGQLQGDIDTQYIVGTGLGATQAPAAEQ